MGNFYKWLLSILLLTMYSSSVFAREEAVFVSGLPLSYVEGDYLSLSHDTALSIQASYKVSGPWQIRGSFTDYDNSTDLIAWTLGTSFAVPLSKFTNKPVGNKPISRMMLGPFVLLNYEDDDVSNDTGVIIGSEYRFLVIPALELFADLSIDTTDDNDFFSGFGVRWNLAPLLSLTGELVSGDGDTLIVGLRYNL